MKKSGKIIIAITHDDHYFDVADKILKLEMGKVEFYKSCIIIISSLITYLSVWRGGGKGFFQGIFPLFPKNIPPQPRLQLFPVRGHLSE